MFIRKLLGLGAVVAFGIGAQGSQAATLVTNGSFEDAAPGFTPPSNDEAVNAGDKQLQGWSIVDSVAWLKSGAFGVTAQDGNYFLDITGYGGNGSHGGVAQDIATVAGQSYTLSFYLGFNNGVGGRQGPVSATVSVDGTSSVFATATTTSTVTTWQQFDLDFTATSASTPISIVALATAGDLVGLDNVAVLSSGTGTPGVPLPASAPLFGGALLAFGVAGYGLKRQKRAAAV